jgi:23S rRNA (adenine2030-N6)-methyltransferase
MNYRHAFHAGNFADVLKHAVLTRCLLHLNTKPAPYRVIDTHAGLGLYDLGADAASRTVEWRQGIARLLTEPVPAESAVLLQPYLQVIEKMRAFHGPNAYPGSPEIARQMTRGEDRMIFVEKHPIDAKSLKDNFAFDGRAKVMARDAYEALKACVPPKERRGLVLMDPPFEERDEFERMLSGFFAAYAKWPTGTYMLWYPMKDPAEVNRFHRALADSLIPKILCVELRVRAAGEASGLAATGLIIVNPPWTLMNELQILMPFLDQRLAQGSGHGWRAYWLQGDRVENP